MIPPSQKAIDAATKLCADKAFQDAWWDKKLIAIAHLLDQHAAERVNEFRRRKHK